MTGSRLRPPAEWADRYARQRHRELFARTMFEAVPLRLSVNVSRDYGFPLDQVAADLRAGVIVEERDGRDGVYYCVSGTAYKVFVSPRDARYSGLPIAWVTSIKSGTGFDRRATVCPGDVVFDDVRDEVDFDLGAMAAAYEHALRVVRDRQRAVDRARRELASGQPQRSAHGRLHRDVRQRYSSLRAMFALLEKRAERARRPETAAEVTAADQERVELSLTSPAGFVEGRVVDVAASGEEYRLPILSLDGRDAELPQPRAAPQLLRAGDQVTLSQQERFAMGKHAAALDTFLNANVEGDWHNLATLLCDPASLPPAPPLEPTEYLSGVTLNKQQKRAVAGALGTPHAYFIQGPPGTGKTTVITELVLQLVTRGERVLLLAPMHVAVDEVLGRIGDRPEVFAVRLAHDDRKVSDELQRFLPTRLREAYLKRARTPATSRAVVWRAEARRLAGQRDVLLVRVEAGRAFAGARAAEAAAGAAFRTWEKAFQRAWAAASQRVGAADAALAQLATALPRTQQAAADLRQQVAALSAGQRFRSWFRRMFGERDAVYELTTAARAAAAEVERLTDGQRRWVAERAAADAALSAAHADREGRGLNLKVAWERDRQALAEAERRLAKATDAVALPAGTDAETALASVTARITALQQREVLEARWFEAARPDDPEQLAQELRRAVNVVCCTTTGVAAKLLDGLDFDTLIVDEASRVVDSEFLIGAVRARRWILVGDEKQLPPYVDSADEHHLHAVAALHKGGRQGLRPAVDELATLWRDEEEAHAYRTEEVLRTAQDLLDDGSWAATYRAVMEENWPRRDADRPLLTAMLDHLVRSLFERAVASCPGRLRTRLVEQRRMIEPIAALVRRPVYDGDYVTPSPADLAKHGITPLTTAVLAQPVTLLDTSSYGAKARHEQYHNGCFNRLEVDWVVATCEGIERELRLTGAPPVTVSVLTFYRRQATLIRAALGWPATPRFRALRFRVVDAIDKVQGQEADLVIVSFCRAYVGHRGPRAGAGRWLQDVRRLNVACTRARRALVLVGHGDTLRRLRGVPAAERFYAGLFAKLDGGAPGYGLVKDR